jgi:hypothetical protein
MKESASSGALFMYGFYSLTQRILEMMGIDSRLKAKLKGKITAIMGCDD